MKATIEGVVRFPSLFAITTGSFPSITDTHEFVVPRSMPIILLMFLNFQFVSPRISTNMPLRNSGRNMTELSAFSDTSLEPPDNSAW
jgi:hypothetical protein